MSEFSQEPQARSIAPGVPGGYLMGVTIPPFQNSPQIHLQPLLPKGTALMGTSQSTTDDIGLSALPPVPQQYFPPRLPHSQSTTTRDNLYGPSDVRTSHEPNCGDRSKLPSSGVLQDHPVTRLPHQQPITNQETDDGLLTTSAVDDPQGVNPSPSSSHGPEPDAPQSSNPIPLPRNNQNHTPLQNVANSRQYVPLAPQWSPAILPFGILMPPPDNPPLVVPNANNPSTPFQRALNRAGAQLASRNVEMNVREDKDKKFGIADNELTYADVLLGRGGWINSHPGNVFFRALVDEYRMEYATAGRGRKTSVAKKVVHLIRNNHGRFLKKDEDDDLWFEVGDQKAIEKTGQTLREGMAKVVRESLVSHVATQARNGAFLFSANAPSGAENNQE